MTDLEASLELAKNLEPVTKFINGMRSLIQYMRYLAYRKFLDIFLLRFRDVYQRYDETLNFIVSKSSNPKLEKLWGVFATVCVNTGRVIVNKHFDSQDEIPGLCWVVAGSRNLSWKTCARLCIQVGNDVLEFVLPPGIPIAFPSALFLHWNTTIKDLNGTRFSLVYFTGAALFQWRHLGGRRVSDLSTEERKAYVEDFKRYYDEGISKFPLSNKNINI
jgi:hypothetical protein